jgi:hypothetical protein
MLRFGEIHTRGNAYAYHEHVVLRDDALNDASHLLNMRGEYEPASWTLAAGSRSKHDEVNADDRGGNRIESR